MHAEIPKEPIVADERPPRVARRLFWKIYVWFVLATLVLAAAVTLTVYFTDPDLIMPVRRSAPIRLREQQATRAVEIYEQLGREGLQAYVQSLTTPNAAGPGSAGTYDHVYLFDETGRELTGDVPPSAAGELLARVKATGDQNVELRLGKVLVARPVVGPNGSPYIFLSTMPRKSLLIPVGLLGWLRFGIALVAAAAVCYWLSRYVLAPVQLLRTAARRLAGGDLSARVCTPALAGRRDEFSELALDFDEMASRIESLLAAQRRLIADVSHELGSPLTRVNVALRLAERKAGPEVRPELDRIECEVRRLTELIHQLLLLSRLESHAGLEPAEEFDLKELVEEVAADAAFEAMSTERGIQVHAPGRCLVRGTRHVLRSAVENVVRNAIHHTARDTRVVIELKAAPEPGQAVLQVRDYGAGVPAATLEKLFEPFYRVSEARERASGGAGLGLAIAEHAIKAHGGSIAASNAEGGGLQVEIRLALARS